jgi:putative PIN family toxin of toxin-antitoxin system
MIRVVIDSSVLVRYLLKPSKATKQLVEQVWFEALVEVITAPELMAELAAVLARPKIRHYVTLEDAGALTEALTQRAEVLPPLGEVPAYTRDRKDDKFVACALLGCAHYLVTYDDDLLVLGAAGAVEVLTPEALVKRLRS